MHHLDAGQEPGGPGWFVLNLVDAVWREVAGMGRYARFEGEKNHFEEFGVNVHVLEPGENSAMYHGEGSQEAFLVLHGECVLIVEGQERRLRAWDFVHSPPWTRHVFVGAGTGPCAILMIGARGEDKGLEYPVDEAAVRHGAGVEVATESPREAYAGVGEMVAARYRPGSLGEPA
jgi:uncharacterized cupin superfamily protein